MGPNRSMTFDNSNFLGFFDGDVELSDFSWYGGGESSDSVEDFKDAYNLANVALSIASLSFRCWSRGIP